MSVVSFDIGLRRGQLRANLILIWFGLFWGSLLLAPINNGVSAELQQALTFQQGGHPAHHAMDLRALLVENLTENEHQDEDKKQKPSRLADLPFPDLPGFAIQTDFQEESSWYNWETPIPHRPCFLRYSALKIPS